MFVTLVENQNPIFGDTEDTDEGGRHKKLKSFVVVLITYNNLWYNVSSFQKKIVLGVSHAALNNAF